MKRIIGVFLPPLIRVRSLMCFGEVKEGGFDGFLFVRKSRVTNNIM
jgi:hypothetical protein